jgi:hypothetical protein
MIKCRLACTGTRSVAVTHGQPSIHLPQLSGLTTPLLVAYGLHLGNSVAIQADHNAACQEHGQGSGPGSRKWVCPAERLYGTSDCTLQVRRTHLQAHRRWTRQSTPGRWSGTRWRDRWCAPRLKRTPRGSAAPRTRLCAFPAKIPTCDVAVARSTRQRRGRFP